MRAKCTIAIKSGEFVRSHQIFKRLSVAIGMRHMYLQYRHRKLNDVKRLAVTYLSAPFSLLQGDRREMVVDEDEQFPELFERFMISAEYRFRRNS
jgi:hypothetical protein